MLNIFIMRTSDVSWTKVAFSVFVLCKFGKSNTCKCLVKKISEHAVVKAEEAMVVMKGR